MNANTSVEQAKGTIDLRAILRIGIFLLLLVPMALFIPAGRLDWGMGWVFVGLFTLSTVVSRGIVMRQDPELIAERARIKENTKGWDRMLASLITSFGLIPLIVAGLDMRLGWLPVAGCRLPDAEKTRENEKG